MVTTRETLQEHAHLHKEQGKYEESLSLYQQILQIDEETYGQKHEMVAFDFRKIGDLYQQMGQYSQALTYLLQAVTLDSELGEEHPQSTLHLTI